MSRAVSFIASGLVIAVALAAWPDAASAKGTRAGGAKVHSGARHASVKHASHKMQKNKNKGLSKSGFKGQQGQNFSKQFGMGNAKHRHHHHRHHHHHVNRGGFKGNTSPTSGTPTKTVPTKPITPPTKTVS